MSTIKLFFEVRLDLIKRLSTLLIMLAKQSCYYIKILQTFEGISTENADFERKEKDSRWKAA